MVAALNGDVDNHADLKAHYGLRIPAPITTDAKVIPALVSRHVAAGHDAIESFRRTVASFEGSVAIAAASSDQPDQVLLALRGSGQALYVGLADGAFIVASEPYGLVEETQHVPPHGRRDAGPARGGHESGPGAGARRGPRRARWPASAASATTARSCRSATDDLVHAEITTRDIDRGTAPHFLLKEITEAPTSFAKTLRGRIREDDAGMLHAHVGEAAIPPALAEKLSTGAIRRVVVIGQGTAAIAGMSMADVLGSLLADTPDHRAGHAPPPSTRASR